MLENDLTGKEMGPEELAKLQKSRQSINNKCEKTSTKMVANAYMKAALEIDCNTAKTTKETEGSIAYRAY